ncbi:MAG: HD domain-containing protein [Candidatus Heimdallarchaeota archaeon]
MEELHKKLIEYCKVRIGSDPVSGLDHVQRVLRWCEVIGEKEDANLEVLRISAILHDIAVSQGRAIHAEAGAEMAHEFLQSIGIPDEKIKAITEVIRGHSRYGGPEPTTLEGFILRDADMLDYIGAIGIVRAILRDFQDKKYHRDPETVPEMIQSLKDRVEDKFYTNIARQTAQSLFKFMDQFIDILRSELTPDSIVD